MLKQLEFIQNLIKESKYLKMVKNIKCKVYYYGKRLQNMYV